MLRDKVFIWLLVSYVLLQLGSLFFNNGLFFFAYIIVYLWAVFYMVMKSAKAIMRRNDLKVTLYAILFFFIANLILFLIYIPTLLYNPEINWKLKGEVEQDPKLFQAYVPVVFFVTAGIIIILTTIITKIIFHYRGGRTG